MDIVVACGSHIEVDGAAPGYWRVTVWRRTSAKQGATTEETYRRLSWVEATDVVLACYDADRPGTGRGGGFSQGVLWGDE